MKILKSYQSKFLLSFLGLSLMLACWVYFHSQIDVRNERLDDLAAEVKLLETDYLTNTRHLQNFLLYGYHETNFYTQGKQHDIDSFETYLLGVHVDIEHLKLQFKEKKLPLEQPINLIAKEKTKLISLVKDIKSIYREKGYKDFGVEGRMRHYAHILQDSFLIPELDLLKLRKDEKDFLLRGEERYAVSFTNMINAIIAKETNNRRAKDALINYKNYFTTLVAYNKQIGIYSADGLYNSIQVKLADLNKYYLQLNNSTEKTIAALKSKNDRFLYIGAVLFFLIVSIAVWRLSKYLSEEIKKLNEIVLSYIHSGFKPEEENEKFRPKILEVTILNRSFALLKHRLSSMLEEKNNHRKMLVAAVIEGQEKERKNIGAELHDNINPSLATAKMFMNVARDHEADRLDMIHASTEIVDNCIKEIRKLSHSLVGPPDKDFALKDSLKDLVANIELGSSFKVTFDTNEFDESQISENKKMTLYRIAQEQLNNVVKYANAKDVFITIKEIKKELLFSIKDNGIGFDSNKTTKGIGLRNIETRLELVNGKMLLITSPGNGCEMCVVVPV